MTNTNETINLPTQEDWEAFYQYALQMHMRCVDEV